MIPRTVAVALAAVAFLATLVAVASPAPLVFGLLSQLIFVLPGVLILRAIAPAQGWLPACAFGPFVGQALGSLAITALWMLGGRGAWLLVAAPAIVAVLIVPARKLQGRWNLPATEWGDGVALPLLLLLVPLIVGLPFAHVGDITPAGQAYRAYFTSDYVWRRAVVIELAKGAAPLPINPYFNGDALHYYWMPHVLSAVQYTVARSWATLDELLLIHSIAIDAFFVAFLYGMVRLFRVRSWAAAVGAGFVLVSTSFEGAYVMFDNSSRGRPWLAGVRDLNIDAISRWYFQGIPIDGLQRLLFYQPHHATGYVIGLIGLLVLAVRRRERDNAAFAIAGLCLGLSIVISSFAGLMVTAAAALYEAVGVIRSRDVGRAVGHAISAALPLGAAVAMVFGLRYVDGGSVLEFGINRVAVHDFVRTTLLSCGPVLIVTALAVPSLAAERRGVAIFGALAVTSIVFYFLINVKDHQDVYVGWRVGHFMFMSAAVIGGILAEQIAISTSSAQPLQLALFAIALVGGLPTTIIDVYNTQDISEHGEPPYWTMMLRPDELQAFDWINKNTRADAIFQVDPIVRQAGSKFDNWAYLPAFAERRMAYGLPISMVPLAKYEQASNEIQKLFDEDPLAAYERAKKAKVNYVFIGPPERSAHQGVDQRFESLPNQFALAFKNATISIYEVR